MFFTLLVIQFIIVFILICLVLSQNTEADSLASLGDMSKAVNFSIRARPSLFNKLVYIMAFLFIANSLGISILLSQAPEHNKSIISKIKEDKVVTKRSSSKKTK